MGKKPVTGVDICTLSKTYQFSEEKKNIINFKKIAIIEQGIHNGF